MNRKTKLKMRLKKTPEFLTSYQEKKTLKAMKEKEKFAKKVVSVDI